MLALVGRHFTYTLTEDVSMGFEATHVCVLDFNQCQRISRVEERIDQAVKRFLDNNPYYPRPPASPNDPDLGLCEILDSQCH